MVPRGRLSEEGGTLEAGDQRNGGSSLEIRERWTCLWIFLVRPNGMLIYYQVDGSAEPSVAAVLLEELPDGDARAEKEQIAKNCAGTALTGMSHSSICQDYLLIAHRWSRYCWWHSLCLDI